MMIKLAIIGTVLLAGGILFSSEITEMFPKSVGTLSGVEEDITSITESTLQNFDTKIDNGINDVNMKLDELTESSTTYVTENIKDKLPEIKTPQIFAGAESP